MIDHGIQLDPRALAPASAGKAGGASSIASVFEDLIERAKAGDAPEPGAKPDDELREAAEMFVSTAMIMPMFQRMREDPLAANLMHGGRTEKIFQQQLDQILSDRIASASSFDLVDAVYNQLDRQINGGGVNTHG